MPKQKKYYIYKQKRNGGYYRGPAHYVIIRADTPNMADFHAIYNGVYFDGVEKNIDLCENRWNHASEDYCIMEDKMNEILKNSVSLVPEMCNINLNLIDKHVFKLVERGRIKIPKHDKSTYYLIDNLEKFIDS